MKKTFMLILLIMIFSLSHSKEIILDYEDYSMKEPVIQSGEKKAKKSIATKFIYQPLDQYLIYCRMGFLSTIKLQEGEKLVHIGGGDTARWTVTHADSKNRTSIYIKPFYEDIKTNLVIVTNEREYQFHLVSAKVLHNPIITFDYPNEERTIFLKQEQEKEKNTKNYTQVDINNLYFDYNISRSKYNFAPSQVFDDGLKTYLVMKPTLQETPVVFIENDGEESLINFRFVDGRMVIDRLFEKAIVKLGKKEVKITRESGLDE